VTVRTPPAAPPRRHRTGTFSYLPPLSRDELARQVEYALAKDWTCSLEHVEPGGATRTYWYLWKLPLFDVRDPGDVLAELDACVQANPGHLVRLVAYDRRRQTQGLSFVVHQGAADPEAG
jgi:ribulose-bisphosphate carboxylase small chain